MVILLNMSFQRASEMPSSKFMYVKQDFLQGIQQNGQPKVLINPNFMKVAHVKPHFNKQFLLNQTIHVNPNMLKQNVCAQVEKAVVKPVTKALVTTPTKLIRVPQKKPNSPNNVLVSTRTKLVRIAKGETKNTPLVRRTSIHTKYKIIRHSPTKSTTEKRETDIKKLYYVKNQFRIDHRSPKSLKSSLLNKSFNTTLTTKNVYVKCNSKLNKTQYVSINGILYRRSAKSLVTLNKEAKTNNNKVSVKRKEQLLTIRGQKYKLDSNHRTLTLLTREDKKLQPNFKTIYVGGVTFKQKEPNVFVKTNANQKHILLSQAKQRSINTLTNKMKKCNIPCPFYHRFGKCKGKENGTCIRTHNPNQVSLCPKFLQGACVNNACFLSHKVSHEKMPTCKFFLEGLCSKDDCPYLHVKINAKAEICKDFVEGFCKKAAECDKRHQYLCPDYEKSGSCTKRKCPYPHGNMVRKYKFTTSIASKLQAQTKTGSMNNKNHPVSREKTTFFKNIKLNHKSNSATAESNLNILEKALNLRYYDESTSGPVKEVQKECAEFEIVDLDLEQSDSSFVSSFKKRPRVGDLPSFIPFLDEDEN